MRIFEITIIYITISFYYSKATDMQNSLNNSMNDLPKNSAIGYKTLPYDIHYGDYIDNNRQPESSNQESNDQRDQENAGTPQTETNHNSKTPCDLLYIIRPPQNATVNLLNIKLSKNCCVENNADASIQLNTENIKPEIKFNSQNEKSNILNRDTDSFYDEEVERAISDDNRELSEDILSVNEDPYLVDGKQNTYSNEKKLKKREESKEHVFYDYNYYDDKPAEENSGIKNVMEKPKQKMGKFRKLLSPKQKAKTTTSRLISTHETTGVSKEIEWTKITSTIKPQSSESMIDTVTPSLDGMAKFKAHQNNELETNVIPENINKGLEENENIVCAPKMKNTCNFENSEEKLNCLPQGGVPKNPGIPLIGKNRDPQYQKLIRGELSEKVTKTIMKKVSRNREMSSELGICDVDLKDIKDLFNEIRSKQNDCCMKMQGELKCFLNWLLTVDPSRKKRTVFAESVKHEKDVSNKSNEQSAICSTCIELHDPSPQYRKLFKEVERVREAEGTD